MPNLVKRTLTALILGPLFVMLAYFGGLPFFFLIVIMFVIMFYEWVMITRSSEQKLLWGIFGFFYIGFACFVMLFLERMRYDFLGIEAVPVLLFALVFLVWISDIFSYVFGRAIGGPKLAPKISPNKTWAGAFGGIIACLAFFFIMNYVTNFGANRITDQVFITAMLVHVAVPIFALVGDLFESLVKRKFGVKDSGNIIPGHGGLLDRMDAMIMVMNVTGITFFILFALEASKKMAQGATI